MKKITLLAMSLVMAFAVNAQDTGNDLTGTFTNTDFEVGDNSGWTWNSEESVVPGHNTTAADNGFQGTHFMEAWCHSSTTLLDFDWSQTKEVPNGHYMVTALAHAIWQNQNPIPEPHGVYVYAEDKQVEVTSTSASEFAVLVEVTDGELTIGFRGVDCDVNWVVCDYFQVTQCFGSTEDELKTSWAKCEMTKLGESLNDLTANTMYAGLRNEIKANIANIESVTTFADANALWQTLKQQAADADTCIVAYENLILKIDEAYAIADDGVEGDALDALFEATDAAQEKYDDESLDAAGALAETETLTKAIFDYNTSIMTGEEGVDVTELYVINPTWRERNNTKGWDVTVERKMDWGSFPAWGNDLAEVYQSDFNISQTLTGIPNGKYKVRVQAFYRGNEQTAELFANNSAVKVLNINKYTTSDFGTVDGNITDKGLVDNLTSASAVFNTVNAVTGRNFYDENELEVIVMDGTLTFGVRSTTTEMGTWFAFRDFKLFYYGNFPYINLLGKVNSIRDYLTANEASMPSAVWLEMDEYLYEAEEYTYEGAYSDAEVNAVIVELDSMWNNALKAVEVYAEVGDLVAYTENELAPLEYNGLDDLWLLIDEGYEYLESSCETNTYDVLLDYKNRLEKGITDYMLSQDASLESAADYTFLVANSNFEEKGEWTWSVTAGGTDLWVGGCRPTEEGGESRRGVNLWGWGISSIDVHQKLTGLPNGLYKVSADLITQNNYATDQHVYATGAATVVSDPLPIAGWDSYEWTTLTTNDYAVVVDGTLIIGAASSQGGTNSEAWFQATNFKLYYYGEASAEDQKTAWDELLVEANEALKWLIPNEQTEIEAAIAEATPLADAGKYGEASSVLNPAVTAWAEAVVATQNFYGGYYAKLDTIRLYENYDGCEMVYSFADATIALADVILAADTTTHKAFAELDNRIHAYANYAAALRDSERAIKSGEYNEHSVKIFTDSILNPQLEALQAVLRPAEYTNEQTAALREKLAILKQSNNLDKEIVEGDVTYLIANPTVEVVEGEDLAGWTVLKNNAVNCGTSSNEHYSNTGGVVNHYLDAWNGTRGANTATFYQELHAIPDGVYRLTVAARTDGNNAYIIASSTEEITEATQFAELKKYGAEGGEIWQTDSLQWEADGCPTENLVENYPYFMARPDDATGLGKGYGWSWHVIENIEVTNHYLYIGLSADRNFHGQKRFTGTWFGADDWKLELVKKSDVQSEYDPFAGIENVEAAAPAQQGIYDLFGRRIETITVPGIYIMNGKKVVIK